MSNSERAALAKDVERHCADLTDVSLAVAYWQPAAHHVRVSDRLHLSATRLAF